MGINGSAHSVDGMPLVNKSRFPDMLAMTRAVRALGPDNRKKNVTMGFYMNNCYCHQQEIVGVNFTKKHTYQQDIDLVVSSEFDGLKIDGCGPNHDIDEWIATIKAKGRPIVVENCGDNNNGPTGAKQHWSPPLPSDLEKCDSKGNFYRVSKDIAPQFHSAMFNLQYTVPYTNTALPTPLSRPGCWAYPDSECHALNQCVK